MMHRKIRQHVSKARKKHPKGGKFWPVLMEEIGEIAQAEQDGDYQNAKNEAYDTIAVLIRYILEDFS
jgi:hypothetical protein